MDLITRKDDEKPGPGTGDRSSFPSPCFLKTKSMGASPFSKIT